MDHASPKFLDSLKLMCTKGTSEYMAFMTKAGMCMAGCSDPQELFINEFAGACSWYAAHKDDVCGAEPAPVTPPASTTTPPAATTTPPVAGTTTNVPIHTGAPVPSSGSSTPPAAASSGAAAVSNNGTVPAASGASSPAASGAPGASGASGAQPAASASAGGANNQAQQPPNAANKLSMGGFVIAMIASAGYLAL